MRIFIILALFLITITSAAQEPEFSVSPYCDSHNVQEFERMDAMANSYWWAKEMVLSPDNRFIATASLGYGRVQLYDAHSLDLIYTFAQNGSSSAWDVSLSWSPDSKFLAIGTWIFTDYEPMEVKHIEIWDIERLEVILEIPNVEIDQIIWSSDGDKLAVLEIYGNLSIWNTLTGELISAQDVNTLYDLHPQIMTWIMDDTRLIAIDGFFYSMIIWETETNQISMEQSHLLSDIASIAWNSQSSILTTYSFSLGLVWLENFPNSDLPETITSISDIPRPSGFLERRSNWGGYIFDMAWSHNHSTLALGTGNGLALIDGETEEITEYIGNSYPEFAKLAWFSDNNTLAALTRWGVLFTWDIANECLIAVVEPVQQE